MNLGRGLLGTRFWRSWWYVVGWNRNTVVVTMNNVARGNVTRITADTTVAAAIAELNDFPLDDWNLLLDHVVTQLLLRVNRSTARLAMAGRREQLRSEESVVTFMAMHKTTVTSTTGFTATIARSTVAAARIARTFLLNVGTTRQAEIFTLASPAFDFNFFKRADLATDFFHVAATVAIGATTSLNTRADRDDDQGCQRS